LGRLFVENETSEQVEQVPVMTPGSLHAILIRVQQNLLRSLHLAQQLNLDRLFAFVY
jgi:hypothetical protein